MNTFIGQKRIVPRNSRRDEELGAIGVLSSVGHRQKTNLGVLQLEVLIWETVAVDYHQLAYNRSNGSPGTYWTFRQCHRPL